MSTVCTVYAVRNVRTKCLADIKLNETAAYRRAAILAEHIPGCLYYVVAETVGESTYAALESAEKHNQRARRNERRRVS